MLTVHEVGRHGLRGTLNWLFRIGSTAIDEGSKGHGRDRKREESRVGPMLSPEARVPYDFNRIRGPGGVR